MLFGETRSLDDGRSERAEGGMKVEVRESALGRRWL